MRISYVYKDVRYAKRARPSPPNPREASAPRGGPAGQRPRALASLRQAALPLRRGRGTSRHLPERHARRRAHGADLAAGRAGPGRRTRGRPLPRLVGGHRAAVRDQPRPDPAATSAAVFAAQATRPPLPPTAAAMNREGGSSMDLGQALLAVGSGGRAEGVEVFCLALDS